ncbi:hypothetical protein, partial [Cupriavidus sp. DL-D2]|uniref:hypothetical protein n=1 Tax=Cupriavidus sp. DL-D2 TaxID=3144974 RepID=UPI003214FCAA
QNPATPATAAPQPLSLLRLQRGLCCEGANIKTDSEALQHVCHGAVERNWDYAVQAIDLKGK